MSFKTPETRSLASSSRKSAARTSTAPRTAQQNKNSFSFSSFHINDLPSNVEDQIMHDILMGDHEGASYWIDLHYEKITTGIDGKSPLKIAKFVELLSMTQQWARVNTVLWTEDKLYQRHIYFAYYHVNALYHQKQYNLIQSTPLAHLVDIQGTPIRGQTIINGFDITLSGNEVPITLDETKQLDDWAGARNFSAALLNVLGKTFLNVGNRGAAAICFKKVLRSDRNCLHAEQLVLQHRLFDHEEMLHIKKQFEERENPKTDPRILAAKAKDLYARGNPKEAVKITSGILDKYGWYLPCLLTHVDSLTMLEDADALFVLGHQLVDSMPDHHYSWYTVAMYYYTCKTQPNCKGLAKQYMNKAVQMNEYFGEGFLALGHILAADSENDQALNSYYKSARLMEKNFEPYLYISTLYTGNGLELANSFINDALNYAPNSPILLQQIGCILYNERNFKEAMTNFEKALKLVMSNEDNSAAYKMTKAPCEYLKVQKYKIEKYWAPLLNNLGHCARRLQRYEEGDIYHECASHLQPNDVKAMGSHAICLLHSVHNADYGHQLLSKALTIQPFDSVLREIQDIVITLYNDFQSVIQKEEKPLEELDEFFERTRKSDKIVENFQNKSVAKKLMKPRK